MLFASSTDSNLIKVGNLSLFLLIKYLGIWSCHGQLFQSLVLLFNTDTKATRISDYQNFKKTLKK